MYSGGRNHPLQSTSQKSILTEFTQLHGLSVYHTYVDDGFSGTNFERPAFRQMIRDIENHKVNMVITKDLSRLGRDYIMTGHYMERYFPEHDVRYISILDGIDTGPQSVSNDIVPFQAILNDMYSKDLSNKIKSVMRDKQCKGLFVGWKPPYGYTSLPETKDKLVIDPEAAKVVRQVFTMALSGFSTQRIADTLNKKHIPTPSTYAGICVGNPSPNTGLWRSERICEMLTNEVYIGNMVQRRREKISYKSKKFKFNPPDAWVVVAHTHEPIIDEDSFRKVDRILSSRKSTRSRTFDSLLKGILCCRECQEPLTIINRRNAAGEDQLFYICRTYHRSTKSKLCTCHSIKEQTVTDAVLSNVQEICGSLLKSEELLPIAKEFLDDSNIADSITAEIQDLEQQLSAIGSTLEQIYSDKLSGILAPEDFQRIYEKINAKRKQLTEEQSCLKIQLSAPVDPAEEAQSLVEKFMRQVFCHREFLVNIIDRIEFSEDKELFLRFRFRNPDLISQAGSADNG